jgi:hypothetical protein
VRAQVGDDVPEHLHCERDRPRERANVFVVWQEASIEFFVFEFEVDSVEEANSPGNRVQLARS